MNDEISRRKFFLALGASVIAAGVTLPVGMPANAERFFVHYSRIDEESLSLVLGVCITHDPNQPVPEGFERVSVERVA